MHQPHSKPRKCYLSAGGLKWPLPSAVQQGQLLPGRLCSQRAQPCAGVSCLSLFRTTHRVTPSQKERRLLPLPCPPAIRCPLHRLPFNAVLPRPGYGQGKDTEQAPLQPHRQWELPRLCSGSRSLKHISAVFTSLSLLDSLKRSDTGADKKSSMCRLTP